MNIILDYSWWFILLCVFIAGLYSGFLYYKNAQLKEFPIWVIRLIALFRFLVVFILSFLLLSPLLESITEKQEKPIVVFAQDVSESILLSKDSVFYRGEYLKAIESLKNRLSEKYETYVYTFSGEVNTIKKVDSINYTGKQTDISLVFDELEARYSNRNVGAVILASDGLYNKGGNPLYASEKVKGLLYTVAMGDVTVKKDLTVLKVEHNRITYLGNKFPLNIIVTAKELKGESSILTVQKNGETLFKDTLEITSEDFIHTVPVVLEAKEIGLQKLTIRLSPIKEEVNNANNIRNVYMEVLDARKKVLILCNAPHPDVAAIKNALEVNQNYEVESYTAKDFTKPLNKYNLVILHQIPNATTGYVSLIDKIKAASLPVWAISGANTVLDNDLRIMQNVSKTNACEIAINKSFSLFTLSDDLIDFVDNMPAVVCPFGSYKESAGSTVLFKQKIGAVVTESPVMVFNSNADRKSAVFYGEGLWKWRLNDFSEHGSHQLFDEFISKTVQYLSVNADKSYFRVNSQKSFLENEAIVFDAEVYNQSYELINEPDVNLEITDTDGKKFPFVFSKTNQAYTLNAGRLPVGEYTFEAKVKVDDKLYLKKGAFSVLPIQVESITSVADHHLLYRIAENHDGEMVYPNDLSTIEEKLNARDDIKTIIYTQSELKELIHFKWIFYLLLLLLSLEWFMRKRNGAY